MRPMAYHILDHPLVRCLLSRLRNRDTQPSEFRLLVAQITTFLGIEATKDLALQAITVHTPISATQGHQLKNSIAIVPVLRAGLGMAEPLFDLLPQAAVRHVGLFRDESSLLPVTYYQKLPRTPAELALVVDPMLATGGTAIATITMMKEWGVADIRFLGILGAPEGLAALQQAHPEVPIFLAALDEKLNELGYIVPGLGDAGDRQYHTTSA
jgi:uracil phosphoribosyltransferase